MYSRPHPKFNIANLDLSMISYSKSLVLHSKYHKSHTKTFAITNETLPPKTFPKNATSGIEQSSKCAFKHMTTPLKIYCKSRKRSAKYAVVAFFKSHYTCNSFEIIRKPFESSVFRPSRQAIYSQMCATTCGFVRCC